MSIEWFRVTWDDEEIRLAVDPPDRDAWDLLDKLIERRLFDAALAIEAARATSGRFCWPR